MSELYFAERDDLDTVGVDLNGLWHGDTTGFRVLRIKLGVEAKGTFLTEGEIAGGEQVSVQHPPVKGFIELESEGDDIVALRDLQVALGEFLDKQASLVWQPEGYPGRVIIDTYRSDIPSMFEAAEDSEGAYLYEGIDSSYKVEFWHHPHPRLDGVNLATSVEVSNGLGGANLVEVSNPGDTLSEGRLQLAVPGSEHVVWAVVGIKQGTLEFPSYAIDPVEVVFDAWQMIHRQVLEPTDPAAFAGSYRMLAVYTAAPGNFSFEARWGTAVDGPQGSAGTDMPIEHDWTQVSNFQPSLLDLGICRYDAANPRLVIEIWSRSTAEDPLDPAPDVGSFGEMYLIPCDETYLQLQSPGFSGPAYGLRRFRPEDLTLTGTPDTAPDGAVNLASGDVAMVPGVYVDSNSYPIGRNEFEGRLSVRNKDRTREKEGELQVFVNDEGSASITSPLIARRGQAVTKYGEDDRRRVAFDVTDVDDLYKVQVEFTEAGGPGKRIHLEALRYSFVPWVTDGRSMVVDQGRQTEYIADENGAEVADLRRTATFYLPGGAVTLAHLFGVQSPNRYDGVDRRGTLPVIGEVTAANTTDVTPRTLHP